MLKIQNSVTMIASGQGMNNMEWYKFLANTDVPWRQWTKTRWIYNAIDYFLWILGTFVALNTIYWVYSYAPTFQIMQGLVFMIFIVAAAIMLQMYNDKQLVPSGV
jgi:hypothetical protein